MPECSAAMNYWSNSRRPTSRPMQNLLAAALIGVAAFLYA